MERVIFRKEYDPYQKRWGYLAGYPDVKAKSGFILCLPFKAEEGNLICEPHTEVAYDYWISKKLIHKDTDEAEQLLKLIISYYGDEEFKVVEKATKRKTDEFHWQHIQFVNGGNPYICKTAKEFGRLQRKYRLEKIQENFWLANEIIL